MASFHDYSLSPATRSAIAVMGIETPTPIQARTLPALLAGRDAIGQARTGSGKTLAFGIPLVERCRAGQGAAQALVLTPTRELASQVADVVARLGRGHRLRTVELVGGRGFTPQAAALRGGAEIVVGTPGRVLDHLKQGTLNLGALTYLVLDEADEMLDQGFGPDVDRIIGFIPAPARRRQHALFSATLPEWARAIAARLLTDPVVVQVDEGKSAGVAPESVDHVIYDVPEGAKPAVLRALLDEERAEGGATLVFGRTKHGVKKLASQLEREGYAVAALQANLSQNARDRVITSFRKGEVPILVATNVAARGLDVDHLGRVINFDLPENGALFTHRVGRTGRMGRAGQAITLLAPEDQIKWRRLEKELTAAGLAAAFPRRPWTGALPATQVTPLAAAPPTRAPSSAAASARPTERNLAQAGAAVETTRRPAKPSARPAAGQASRLIPGSGSRQESRRGFQAVGGPLATRAARVNAPAERPAAAESPLPSSRAARPSPWWRRRRRGASTPTR